ncbi:MAG TPA: zinc-binding dehydrogenase [Acidimicrobiales bacterium]|nr:zinc-binding dehydrogenase [Acidimicrobiales bacterium]
MRALLFGTAGADTTLPLDLVEMEDPKLPGDDWVLLNTRLTGICGSDSKQILMDFGDGDPTDNAMTALISFPQVLGHEVVGTVDSDGDGARYVLNPWLSCAPRGIDPICPACAAGDVNLCWHFTEGNIQPGIHVGNSADAPGGFGELVPAHRSMLIPVPASIPDEVAVLADPFSVALHAITRNPPGPEGRAVIYGAGALGLSAIAILRALYPSCDVLAIARFPAQRALAEQLGATVIEHEPLEDVVVGVAEWSGGVLRRPWTGLPFTHPGHVDVVYDTIGAPDTTEVGLRVVRARGSVVQMGVNPPGRFEWTPLYFKEVRIVGSNAFGIEEVEGHRQHGLAHYLDLVTAGRIDLSAMLTHTFRLDDWREAFAAVSDQGGSGAIKVAFDLR